MLAGFFNKVVGWFKKDKHPTVAKPDIIQHVDSLIEAYGQNIKRFTQDNDLYETIVKSIDRFKSDHNRVFIQMYWYMFKKLNSHAQSLEHRAACASFIEVMKTIHKGLIEVRQEINQLIQSPEINEQNVKISHTSLLYFIRLADMFEQTFIYLLTGLWTEAVETQDIDYTSSPKYRYKEIEKHADLVVFMINQHFASNVFKDVKTSIDELKKEGKDLLIFLESGDNNAELAETINAGTPLIKGFNFGNIMYINPFLVMGRAYRDMVHMRMLKVRKQQEWMQARIAFLKAKSNNLDPQSEEYLALQRAVESYEHQITEIDSVLNKYFIDEE